MQARMTNIAVLVPDALKALIALSTSAKNAGVPEATASLVHLRASQINGCSVCTEMHSRELKKAGESDERIFAVAAWRDSPHFTDAERAALALTESATRLADRPDPVPDEVWTEAARHYDEPALACLLIEIATINAFNRLSVPVRQPSGQTY
jgi:AhpD family alkylhydroperoxidase